MLLDTMLWAISKASLEPHRTHLLARAFGVPTSLRMLVLLTMPVPAAQGTGRMNTLLNAQSASQP